MQNELKELLQFLNDRNPQVRQIALTNLLGHTTKGSPNRDIFFSGIGSGLLKQSAETECIRDLKLLCRDQLTIAHDAFRALINLSDDSLVIPALSEPSFLAFLVSYILNPPSILADLASMLLSNITSSPSTCAALISLKIPIRIIPTPSAGAKSQSYYPPQSRSATSPPPSPPGPTSADHREVELEALPSLLHAFVQGAKVNKGNAKESGLARKGELHFLASVFANVTMASAGRAFFLTPRPVDVLAASGTGDGGHLEYPLSQLVVFTEHADIIRRGGVASTIKHCAFHIPAHKALLFPDSETVSIPPSSVCAPGINILPYILLPLAGPEEFDLEDQEKLPPALQLLPDTKRREPDDFLRLTHVETLILLGTTRAGREHLRNNGVYEIVRALHLAERNDDVREQVERLVNLLKGEEKRIEEVEEDEWGNSKLKLGEDGTLEGSKVSREVERDEEHVDFTAAPTGSLLDDDDDDKIVEV